MALADATVRVILDVTQFDRDLQRKVESAARRAGRRFESEFNKTSRAAAKRWATEFQDETDKSMAGAGTRAGTTFGDRVRRSARPTGRLTGRDLGEQIRNGLLATVPQTGRQYTRNLMSGSVAFAGQRMGQRLGRAIADNTNVAGVGRRLRRQIEDDAEPGVLAAARTVAGRFASALGGAFGVVSIGRFGALVAGVAGLVSEGIQLAAALEPAIGALGLIPAAAAVAAASISSLVVAFQGMGDALGAAASGDPEKLAEALKNLSPAARSVVQEFAALTPQFRALRLEVQESFFSQVTGELTRLADALLGPVQRGMSATAAAAGRMASGLVDALSSTQSAGAIEEIFNSAARSFDQMNAPLQALTAAMLTFIRATLPAFDQLVATLGAGTTKFANFLSAAAASGQATAWVQQAITTLSQLARVAVSAGRVVGTIFDAARETGVNYLTNLNNALIATRQFLAVGEGRTALVNIFEGIHQAVVSLAPSLQAALIALGQVSRVLGSVGQALSAGLAAAISGIGDAIANAGPGLTRFAQTVGSALGQLGSVLPSIGESLGRLLSAAAPLVSIFGLVAHAGAALLSMFSSLPGPILTIIAAFASLRALGVPNLINQIRNGAQGSDSVFGRMGSAVSNLTTTYRTNLAALTEFRTQQSFLSGTMTSGVGPVSGFGAALGGLSDRARAAGGAIGGSLLRGAQSLIGALGGGIGIALGAASVLVGLWADEQAKADQAVAEHNQRVRQLGATLDKVTGSITNATKAQARESFASGDLADAATHLGLSIDRVADAATGSEAAQGRMLTQIRNSARGALQASGDWKEMEMSASNLGISTETLLSALLGNEDAMKRVQKATEGTDASFSTMQDTWGDVIPDQVKLSTEIIKTASDLQKQADAIQQANAQMSPAQRLAESLGEAMGVLADNSSSAADKARALDSALQLLNGGSISLADAQKASADAVASGGQQMQALIDKYNIAGKSAGELGISTKDLADRQAELGQKLFDSGGQINFASERANGLYEVTKNLRQATLDQAAAIVDNAQKTGGDMAQAYKRAADLIGSSRQQIIQWATDAGFGAEAGAQLADMMGLIPDNVKVALSMENVPAILQQLGTIRGDIELLPDKKSLRLDSNARKMRKELEDFGFTVEDIPGSKDIKITPNTSEAAAALQTFIRQQITSKDPDLQVGANTTAAELDIEGIQNLINETQTELTPSINAPPAIAQWQNLLLGPLSPEYGTPTITPSVDGAQVTTWFGSYLNGLVLPGTPTLTPGVDPAQAIAGMQGLEALLPIPGIEIVPIVDGKPAFQQMGGIMNGLQPPEGAPSITPGVDGKPAENWLEYYNNLAEGNPPTITPELNPGPANLQMDKLLDLSPDQQPKVVPSADITPARGQIQSLIAGANSAQTTGPNVNANTAAANAQLALLLAYINRAKGDVVVGANAGSGYGGVNALVSYANRSSGNVLVTANTAVGYTAVNTLVGYINRQTATITVNTRQNGSIQAAEGGIFKYFAGGGFNSRNGGMRPMPANRAEIVPPKSMRVIGDRARGDEAFIPLVNSARSRAILQTASARMGFDLAPRQQQQQPARATTTVEAGAIVVNAPYSDPALVARAVVNELTREAVV